MHSVAAAAGEDWPDGAKHAQSFHQWPTEANEQNAVLAATRAYFATHKAERVSSAVLADYIKTDETLPIVTPKSLAGRMKGYGVLPRKISHMCYFKADLAPVWAKWLDTDEHGNVAS